MTLFKKYDIILQEGWYEVIGFYNYTVILTYVSLATSIVGIFLAVGGDAFGGIICLFISGLCDMFDGKIANTMKRTNKEKEFGIQIDSLSDIICFGILPIIIGISIGLNKIICLPIFIIYIICGLIRLAYFNVLEQEKEFILKTNKKEYYGLPITSVALIIPFTYIFRNMLGNSYPIVYLNTLLTLSLLFILKFRIKKPNLLTQFIFILLGIFELLFILIYSNIF